MRKTPEFIVSSMCLSILMEAPRYSHHDNYTIIYTITLTLKDTNWSPVSSLLVEVLLLNSPRERDNWVIMHDVAWVY